MNIIDLHCDVLMHCILRAGYRLRQNDGHIDMGKLKQGGVLAQCFAIYTPTHGDEDCTMDPDTYYRVAVETYRRELAENRDVIAPTLTVEDILKNQKQGRISAILTVEDAVALDGKMERVDRWHRDGVKMASLTWNYENTLGFPNSRDPEKMALGLKEFGLQCVERMGELGIIVDVSHLSEGGFWDVVRVSKKPFVASHSCARALCDHPRNLTDDQLRAVANCGGLVGVNFYSRFLRENGEYTYVEDLVRHLRHVADVAGVDTLALGSDFDGVDTPMEVSSCADLPILTAALERCFTPSERDKICRDNALRVFRDVWGS